MAKQEKFKDQTNDHIDQMQQGQNNILVAVRARPLNQKEATISSFETIRILDQSLIVLLDPGKDSSQIETYRKNNNKDTQYAFDYAFDQSIDQNEVYEKTTMPFIPVVLDGYNATVFAYGATGAGKTYTMVGNIDSPGIMYRAMNDLFNQIMQREGQQQISVKVQYHEIYNENIKDLLTADDKNLELREDPYRGVVLYGAQELEVKSTNEILQLLKVGNKNRTKESTVANEASSRSHAILQLQVESKNRGQGVEEQLQVSKFTLVDLAGSERASQTQNKGQRLLEGAKINQSLLVLGNCISSLAESQQKQIQNPFIPYRGSKLTRLLKDSLGGNCRTVMIASISPAIGSFEDTYNTLNYATRAQKIKTDAKRNILEVNSHIENYTNIIDSLKKENENLKKLIQNQNQFAKNDGLANNSKNMSDSKQKEQNLLKQKENVKNLEYEVTTHFNIELETLKNIYDLQQGITNTHFQIFKNSCEIRKLLEVEAGQKRELEHKNTMLKEESNNLEYQKKDLEHKYAQLLDIRNQKISKMKSINFNQSKLQYLMAIYKQGQLMIENAEMQFKQNLTQSQKNEQQLQIEFLHNQLNLRDEVIQDQKNILNANHINPPKSNNNILKNIDQIAEEAKLNFPVVRKNFSIVSPDHHHQPKMLNQKLHNKHVAHKYFKNDDFNNHLPSIESHQSQSTKHLPLHQHKMIKKDHQHRLSHKELIEFYKQLNKNSSSQSNPSSMNNRYHFQQQSPEPTEIQQQSVNIPRRKIQTPQQITNDSTAQKDLNTSIESQISTKSYKHNKDDLLMKYQYRPGYDKKELQQKVFRKPNEINYKQFHHRGQILDKNKISESPYVKSFKYDTHDTSSQRMEKLKLLNMNLKNMKDIKQLNKEIGQQKKYNK